nr:LysR substrate-binding domain-containing protein [uncultured Roseococcus sp.]
MDISDLRVFEAVSRHGSMNQAARELNTVQSNVTARVRALEDELGVALFQRHARGVSVTPAGQRMLPFVGRIRKLLGDAQVAARDDGTPSGTLLLGGLETTTALRLSPLLGRFSREHPAVRLAVSTGTTRKLLGEVLECRVEGAFVAGPVAHPELVTEPVFREELVLVTSPAIPSLAALPEVRELRTVVFQLGCSYRQRLEDLLAGMGAVTATPQEFGSLDAILSCVAAGVGVTLLPRGVAAQAEREGRVALHALPPDRAWVETLFVRRADGYVSSALAAFLDLVRAAGSGHEGAATEISPAEITLI